MEEMNELFYRDEYAREFDAEVISCQKGKKGYEVVLSDTAFYPEGGGQGHLGAGQCPGCKETEWRDSAHY